MHEQGGERERESEVCRADCLMTPADTCVTPTTVFTLTAACLSTSALRAIMLELARSFTRHQPIMSLLVPADIPQASNEFEQCFPISIGKYFSTVVYVLEHCSLILQPCEGCLRCGLPSSVFIFTLESW